MTTVFALICFTYLPESQNFEEKKNYKQILSKFSLVLKPGLLVLGFGKVG
jgi:hypothetical protein